MNQVNEFLPAASPCVWNHRLDCTETPEPEIKQIWVKQTTLPTQIMLCLRWPYWAPYWVRASTSSSRRRNESHPQQQQQQSVKDLQLLFTGASLDSSQLSASPSLSDHEITFTPLTRQKLFLRWAANCLGVVTTFMPAAVSYKRDDVRCT